MRYGYLLLVFSLVAGALLSTTLNGLSKEFLTDEEIKRIQEAQEIDKRVKIYMEAAELRLQTAEERLSGKESVEGDSLEFFAPEDMLDGYYRILHSVMLNLDDAFRTPGTDLNEVEGGLKALKKGTDNAGKQLEILKRIAEEKRKEKLWDLVNRAIDITKGAHEGAVSGLEKISKIHERNRERR